MSDIITSSTLPNCFDRANGLAGLPGTATQPSVRLLNGQPWPIETQANAQRFMEELPDSPVIERGEQGTIVHRFKVDQQTALDLLVLCNRGDILQDLAGNLSRILSARYEQQPGNFCIFTVTAESISFDLPIAEFSADVVELNPSLTKHPRYSILPLLARWRILQEYNAINPIAGLDWDAALRLNLNPLQEQAADELTSKLRKGFDSFYLAGIKVTYSTYSYNAQQMNFGGYVETPWEALDNSLPSRFYLDANGNNIFTYQMAAIAPMFYANGIAWLRLADSQFLQRTWMRRTQSWIGSPAGGTITIPGEGGGTFDWRGIWDEDIYERAFDGYNTDDYQ